MGKGFGDLLYAAQIDAHRAGSNISWTLDFNADNFLQHSSVPVHLSGTTTSSTAGDVQIRIPMSQLPDESQLNYAYTISGLTLSVTPEGGKSLTTCRDRGIIFSLIPRAFHYRLPKPGPLMFLLRTAEEIINLSREWRLISAPTVMIAVLITVLQTKTGG